VTSKRNASSIWDFGEYTESPATKLAERVMGQWRPAGTLVLSALNTQLPVLLPDSGFQVAPYSERLTLDEFNSYCAENE
jgi:hypothetical protein